jgi:hypothetical protein
MDCKVCGHPRSSHQPRAIIAGRRGLSHCQDCPTPEADHAFSMDLGDLRHDIAMLVGNPIPTTPTRNVWWCQI